MAISVSLAAAAALASAPTERNDWQCRLVDGAGSIIQLELAAAQVASVGDKEIFFWVNEAGKWQRVDKNAPRTLALKIGDENIVSVRAQEKVGIYSTRTIATGFCGTNFVGVQDYRDVAQIADGDSGSSICNIVLSDGRVGRFSYFDATLETIKYQAVSEWLWNGGIVAVSRRLIPLPRSPDGAVGAVSFLKSLDEAAGLSGVETIEGVPGGNKATLHLWFSEVGRHHPDLSGAAICTVEVAQTGTTQ